jgi:hypothetical protein
VLDATPPQSEPRGATRTSFRVLLAPAQPVVAVALIVAILALCGRLATFVYADFTYDDAYITMRVARNLANGAGFVFNPGEHVQAVSSPLYGLFSGAIWALAGESAFSIVRLLGAVADSVAAGLLVLLTAGHFRPKQGATGGQLGPRLDIRLTCGAFAGLFYAGFSTAVIISTAGLETPYYCCAIVATFCALQGRHHTAGAFFGSLASLLRPDGALVALVVLAVVAVRERRIPWKCLGIMSVLGGAYAAFALAYYGSIIPQSVIAKTLLERSAANEWFTIANKFFLRGPVAWVAGSFAIAGLMMSLRGRRDLHPFITWWAGYVAAFSTFGRWWPWYEPPVVLGYCVAFGVGFGTLVGRAGGAALSVRIRKVGALVLAVCAVCALGAHTASNVAKLKPALPVYREQRMALAEWLNVNTPTDANVVVEPLGLLAYYTKRRFDDYPGLASPQVTRALKSLGRRIGGSPLDYEAFERILAELRPAVLVLRKEEFETARRHKVVQQYRVAYVSEIEPSWTARHPDLQTMYILVRRD